MDLGKYHSLVVRHRAEVFALLDERDRDVLRRLFNRVWVEGTRRCRSFDRATVYAAGAEVVESTLMETGIVVRTGEDSYCIAQPYIETIVREFGYDL